MTTPGIDGASPPAELLLVRHGETTGESSIRLNGVTDVPLSELGRRQMAAVRDALAGLSADRLLSSPLRRAVEGAGIVRPAQAADLVVVPAFTEIDFGDWEGLTLGDIERRDPARFREWREGGEAFTFPGENRGAFWRRVEAEARRRFTGATGTTVAVLHKGVIKVVWATLLDLDREAVATLPVDLGGVFHLVRTSTGWAARRQNDVRHLGTLSQPDRAGDQDGIDRPTGP